MLSSLSIRNVVLIDSLDLSFHAGLTALTGETGAGKSILLDSLGLALGNRSDSRYVRQGETQASVTAAFEIGPAHPVTTVLVDHGLDPGEGDVMLRRVLSADGRSKAFINDQPVSISLLKTVGAELVEIHGQFDQTGLLDSATHRLMLDLFGGHREATEAVLAAWTRWTEAQAALEEAEKETEDARRDEDYLRHVHQELTELAAASDEEERLTTERTRLTSREKLLDVSRDVIAAIGPDSRADNALGEAARALEKGSALAADLFGPAIAALDRAGIELSEVYTAAVSIADEANAEPDRLQQVDDRLAALREAARKHRCEIGQLPLLLERVSERLAAIEDRSGASSAARQTADEAALNYESAAKTLSAARRAAAQRLDQAVMAELPPLKLERARFATRVDGLDPSQASANGLDRVSFEIATTPGAQLGPLNRIASGGELARIMLALKVVLAQDDGAETIVFDEVDAGVGGATAAAVGDRLLRLGSEAQVLVVTHSPQVAAKAQHHWRVSKAISGDLAMTTVEPLDADARQEEIARMLSGADITEEARAAATALMATGS